MTASPTWPAAAGRGWLRELLHSRRGNIAVEFALAAPVLILFVLGSLELARYVLLQHKIERVAITVSDLVARAQTIKQSEIDDIFLAAGEVAIPYDLPGLGRVIVSSVVNQDGNGPKIAWQRSGGGTLHATSALGIEGGTATLPADFQVRQGETAIIAEVFFDFTPFLSERIVAPGTIYKRAHHRPRLGTLREVEDG